MHVYYAISGNIAKPGALDNLCSWAQQRIADNKAKIIKIAKARPGEKHGRIVLEITVTGLNTTPNGRIVNLYTLKRALQDG